MSEVCTNGEYGIAASTNNTRSCKQNDGVPFSTACGRNSAVTCSIILSLTTEGEFACIYTLRKIAQGLPCQHTDPAVLPGALATVGGEEFKMLAGEMSECTSRIQGGLVGWIERGQTAPMFEQAAYEAEIGELVRAETHFGLHLIKVEAER